MMKKQKSSVGCNRFNGMSYKSRVEVILRAICVEFLLGGHVVLFFIPEASLLKKDSKTWPPSWKTSKMNCSMLNTTAVNDLKSYNSNEDSRKPA
jgi:hypothetical protein